MFRGKIRTLGALGALAIGLGACASVDPAGRWGPDPTMPADHIDGVLDNQVKVINYIQAFAPVRRKFDIAQWGFNIGRQDCEVYMNVLFKLNREKGRNAGVINALSTAATGIATAANSSRATLSYLAAVFGLTSALNEAIFTTYLFSEAPGLVAIKVREMQTSYANKLTEDDIPTEASAYAAIQTYYQMCLPESIEGALLQAVANTDAETKPPEGGVNNSPNKNTKLVAKKR
jgi:hypothetical protein